MNETLRKRPAGSALPGQTQDDQSIPILTERLTLPPLDLDTTLPEVAPEPVSLGLPPAPVDPEDAIFLEEVSAATAAIESESISARLPIVDLDRTPRVEVMPAADSVAFPAAPPEIPAELQDDSVFAVHLEFPPVAAPSPAPVSAPASSPAQSPVPSSASWPSLSSVVSSTAAATSSRSASAAEPGAHWTRIEIELRESILAELSRQLPQDVEQIVREQIEPAFVDIVNRLAIEARMAIAASLREIIERAVKAELHALRARRR